MEWLRSVDLAEYAPNLRGSGVHGGLMVSIIYTKINTGDRINCGNCKLEVTKCNRDCKELKKQCLHQV